MFTLRSTLAQDSEQLLFRPHAAEIIDRFETYNDVDRLRSKLRSAYANLAALEEIAERKGIEIREAFQGAAIGAFRVMAPTRNRFLDLVVTAGSARTGSGMPRAIWQPAGSAPRSAPMTRKAWCIRLQRATRRAAISSSAGIATGRRIQGQAGSSLSVGGLLPPAAGSHGG